MKFNFNLVFLSAITSFNREVASSWTQIGADIEGASGGDNSGWALDLSSDGKVLAVGAPGNNVNGENSGHVRVYQYTGGAWTQIGANIDGEAADDESGFAVALSLNGKVLAVGAPYNDGNGSNSGHVRVYQYTGVAWTQIGANIDGEVADDYSGHAVALSLDGSVLAVGNAYIGENGDNSGHVRVYDFEVSSMPSIIPSSQPSPPSAKSSGDPHFISFAGKPFDYHGECDLILISSPLFAFGTGLLIQIRTKRMDGRLFSYSYISAAAIRIGDNILEVQEDGTIIINGKVYRSSSVRDESNTASNFPIKFGKYHLEKNLLGKKKMITQVIIQSRDTVIDSVESESKDPELEDRQMKITIHANSRTHMLFVKVDGYFQDSLGLLGRLDADDHLYGRDGVTDMSHDINAYGEEWQVRDTEPMLFKDHRAPQYPDSCIYYSSDGGQVVRTHNLRRRLLADAGFVDGLVTRQDAIDACADYVGINKENCISDVMVMQDLEVAEDPSYMSS